MLLSQMAVAKESTTASLTFVEYYQHINAKSEFWYEMTPFGDFYACFLTNDGTPIIGKKTSWRWAHDRFTFPSQEQVRAVIGDRSLTVATQGKSLGLRRVTSVPVAFKNPRVRTRLQGSSGDLANRGAPGNPTRPLAAEAQHHQALCRRTLCRSAM
jgi:hypothetical protein